MNELYRGLRLDEQHPWRSINLGRLFLITLNNWQDALVADLHKAGFAQVRATHIALLRHVDVGGTRITEIARRAGVTKQAIGQLIAACEKQKLMKTIPDPTDRRAKVVLFTKQGRALILAERKIIDKVEANIRTLIGEERLATLRGALEILADHPDLGVPKKAAGKHPAAPAARIAAAAVARPPRKRQRVTAMARPESQRS